MIRHSIITLLFIAGFALTSSAQHQTSQILKGERADTYAPGSELVRLKPFSDVPNYLRFRQGKAIPEAKAFPYLSRFIAQGKGKSGFQLINMNNGSMKMTHKRYVQTINNIPLEYSAYLLHSDNGMVKSMNGNICSDPEISGNFQLSKAEALAAAETHIGADVYIYDEGAESPYRGEFSEPKPEKVYFPDKGNLYSNAFRAAYKIDVFALYPYSRHWVYVDAQTGEVLDKETRIHTTDVPGTAVTAYSGTQSIVTDSYNGYYRLRESGRGNGIETYNCQDDASYQNAVDFTDDD